MSLPAYPTAESARLISCLDGQNGTEPQRWLRSACLHGGGASHGNNRLVKERVKHVGRGGGWGGVVCAVTKQGKPCPSGMACGRALRLRMGAMLPLRLTAFGIPG